MPALLVLLLLNYISKACSLTRGKPVAWFVCPHINSYVIKDISCGTNCKGLICPFVLLWCNQTSRTFMVFTGSVWGLHQQIWNSCGSSLILIECNWSTLGLCMHKIICSELWLWSFYCSNTAQKSGNVATKVCKSKFKQVKRNWKRIL